MTRNNVSRQGNLSVGCALFSQYVWVAQPGHIEEEAHLPTKLSSSPTKRPFLSLLEAGQGHGCGTHMDPAQRDETVLILDEEELLLILRVAVVRASVLLGNDDVCDCELIHHLEDKTERGPRCFWTQQG